MKFCPSFDAVMRYRAAFERPVYEVGGVWATLDPGSRELYPSQNRNRVECIANEPDIDAVRDFYRRHGICRYAIAGASGDLTEEGFERFEVPLDWFHLELTPRPMPARVRRARPGEWVEACPEKWHQETDDAGYIDLVAVDDEDRAVGGAILFLKGEGAYLGNGYVQEAHRGRGHHKRLIEARLAMAAELGARFAFAETFFFLADSHANLRRALGDPTPRYVWVPEGTGGVG